MIGINVPAAMAHQEVIRNEFEEAPFAVRTRHGWLFQGIPSKIASVIRQANAIKAEQLRKNLFNRLYDEEFEYPNSTQLGDSQVKKAWENIGPRACKRTSKGRYEIQPHLRMNENVPTTAGVALNGFKTQFTRNKSYLRYEKRKES